MYDTDKEYTEDTLFNNNDKKIGDALLEEKGRRHGKRSCEGALRGGDDKF